jgi:hypothetical protein
MMWMEICDQLSMANAVGDPASLFALTQDREETIAQHLHLVAAKCRTAELLVELRVCREMLALQRLQLPAPVARALPPPEGRPDAAEEEPPPHGEVIDVETIEHLGAKP